MADHDNVLFSLIPQPPALIVFDFDGVFTDNAVYVDENGKEMVRCLRRDGLGVAMLRDRGVPMLILSTEANPVVAARGRKLELEVFQGCKDKAAFLKKLMAERGINPAQAVYVGDDINDLAAMRLVGCRGCPSDAHPAIMDIADLRLTRPGGHGAVRELCDLVLTAMENGAGAAKGIR